MTLPTDVLNEGRCPDDRENVPLGALGTPGGA